MLIKTYDPVRKASVRMFFEYQYPEDIMLSGEVIKTVNEAKGYLRVAEYEFDWSMCNAGWDELTFAQQTAVASQILNHLKPELDKHLP